MNYSVDVTVITPIYKGSKYIQDLVNMIDFNIDYYLSKHLNYHIEYIFVNDYPTEEINLNNVYYKNKNNLELKLVSNEKNLGIQRSRANGIKKARGKYILILDQDDKINEKTIYSQLKNIKNFDVIVANGYDQKRGKNSKIYPLKLNMRKLKSIKTYLRSNCKIVSPGQTLIKKEVIPSIWLEKFLSNNGSDDYLLWLLMFKKECTFAINFEKLYYHIDSGANFSDNISKMVDSDFEVIRYLEEEKVLNSKELKQMKKYFSYVNEKISGKKMFKLFFKYFSVFFWMIYDYFI